MKSAVCFAIFNSIFFNSVLGYSTFMGFSDVEDSGARVELRDALVNLFLSPVENKAKLER